MMSYTTWTMTYGNCILSCESIELCLCFTAQKANITLQSTQLTVNFKTKAIVVGLKCLYQKQPLTLILRQFHPPPTLTTLMLSYHLLLGVQSKHLSKGFPTKMLHAFLNSFLDYTANSSTTVNMK
jgi:hypothetical protein